MPLRLPFDVIAMQFRCSSEMIQSSGISRRLILARTRNDSTIEVSALYWLDAELSWKYSSPFRIPRDGYLRRQDLDKHGHPGVILRGLDARKSEWSQEINNATILLEMLNALACSNVFPSRVHAPGRRRRVSDPSGCDVYYMLSVDPRAAISNLSLAPPGFARTSVREHIRRGHIRRLASGTKVWVQPAVVNAGRGFGKVHKSYAIGPRADQP
jgi:hypothetical protein